MEITDGTPPNVFQYDDLQVSQKVTLQVKFSLEQLEEFIKLSGDRARIHHDSAFAKKLGFSGVVVHGNLAISPFSKLIGMYLPGEGSVIQSQSFQFRKAVYCNQSMIYSLEIVRLRNSFQMIDLEMKVLGKRGLIITGQCQCLLDFSKVRL